MRLRLTVLFAALAVILCTAVPKKITVDVSSRHSSYVHTVDHTYQVESRFSYGSGWAIDYDTICTNRHVINGSKPEDITIYQCGMEWTVTRIMPIAGIDVALLCVEGPPLNVPLLRQTPIIMGELLTLGGHPHAVPYPNVTWGYACGYWWWKDLAIDGAIVPGMSGGPVFDSDGMLVAMNAMTTTPPGRALGIAIPITAIIEGIANDALGKPPTKRERNTVGY